MKHVSLLALAVTLLSAVAQAAGQEPTISLDADAGLTVTEIVSKRGYAVEEHSVVTSDRYVLTMHRLPKSYDETQQNKPAAANKPAVYLIHGLLDSSFTWVNNFRNQSLAYILADAGYDVWLGNNRGNTWSKKHLDYSTSDDRFWDYSWEEMGKYDLPAMLNYVLAKSGRPTLSYIGHSEGTTQAFVGFSLNQALAKKVSYFGALGPVAYVGDASSQPFLALARTYVDKSMELLGIREIAPRSTILNDVISKYGCALPQAPCDSVIQLICGPAANLNESRIHVYFSQTPAGASVKTLGHYAQGIRDNTFRHYDYGCTCSRLLPIGFCAAAVCKNKQVYGAFDPPAFDLAAIKYPRMALFTGGNDSLATATDVDKLRTQLPTGTIISDKIVPEFSHLDYSWAYNAREKVYEELLAQMKSYEGKGY